DHALQPGHEMFGKMVDSISTTSKMPLQAGTHHSPTQTWSITHRIVGITHIQNALLNQVQDLFIKRGLYTVSNVTGKFLVQKDRFLSYRRIERDCLLDCFR